METQPSTLDKINRGGKGSWGLTHAEEPVGRGVVARVACTLVLPHEVHAAAVGAEVCAQLALVDVCLETKKSKLANSSFRGWQRSSSKARGGVDGLSLHLLTDARGDVWGQLMARRALAAVAAVGVETRASSAEEGVSLTLVDICKTEKSMLTTPWCPGLCHHPCWSSPAAGTEVLHDPGSNNPRV